VSCAAQAAVPRVSVIIPATSTRALLQACLRSLDVHGPADIAHEIIVVLNESDGDEDISREFPDVKFVASPVNLGLAGAGNRGRALARGELLVLLHDDAEVEAGWLEALVDTADTRPEAGAVGSKVLHPDGRLQNAGMILWRDATTSPPWVGDEPDADAFPETRAVDYCGTSSLLVRAAALEAIGGLDERIYPVYPVDIDLAMGLRQAGFLVLYEPRSVIRHHRGASISSERWRDFVCDRNRLLFLEKWASALEEQEPAEPDSVEAVRRALARAEAAAERCRRAEPPKLASPSATFDAEEQQQRLTRSSRELVRAYIADLEARLAESEADRQARLEVIERLDAALKESEADRQARLEVIERLVAALKESDATKSVSQQRKLPKWLSG
jgi:GT2 family glycosyltransferase